MTEIGRKDSRVLLAEVLVASTIRCMEPPEEQLGPQ